MEIAGYSDKSVNKLRDLERATKAVSKSLNSRDPSGLKFNNCSTLSGERTSGFLNQFKKQYDNTAFKAAQQYLKDNDYKKYKTIIDKARNTVALLTGGKKISKWNC